MNRRVTIVMYHYVRDLARSRFPLIKGLSIDRFRRQLDYIQTRYVPVAVEDLLEAFASPHKSLPPNPVLLTFDDGYSDHFLNVFPLLDERGIKACFFPPAQAVLEHRVLDVNKIQFVLASSPSAWPLLDEVFDDVPYSQPATVEGFSYSRATSRQIGQAMTCCVTRTCYATRTCYLGWSAARKECRE